jgi:large subunit ribosomal protein L29
MKAAEIKGLAQSELELQLAGFRSELYNLRFQQATRQLRNPARIRQVKRDINVFGKSGCAQEGRD